MLLKVMKKVVYIICFVLLMGTLTVQGQEYRLTLCEELTDSSKEYEELLEKVLTDNFTEDFIIRYIAKPSFEPEYLFQIRETDNSSYEIEAVVFLESLWEPLSASNFVYLDQVNVPKVEFILDSVKRDLHKRDIDKTLAIKLDDLFNVFTSSMNEVGTGIIIEDGIGYRFKRKNKDEIICGEAWSPNEDSPLGKLVSICDDLTLYAKGEDVDLTRLEERITELYLIMSFVQNEETPYNSINIFE